MAIWSRCVAARTYASALRSLRAAEAHRELRRAVALLDPRSESPGESVSRVRLHEMDCRRRSCRRMSMTRTAASSPGSTSPGRNSEPSGNSIGRSSTGNCASRDSRWRMRSSPRSSARMPYVIWAGRSCVGSGLTSIVGMSFATAYFGLRSRFVLISLHASSAHVASLSPRRVVAFTAKCR